MSIDYYDPWRHNFPNTPFSYLTPWGHISIVYYVTGGTFYPIPFSYLTPWGHISIDHYALGGTILPKSPLAPGGTNSHLTPGFEARILRITGLHG